MPKRFGRNQRRKLREQVASLQNEVYKIDELRTTRKNAESAALAGILERQDVYSRTISEMISLLAEKASGEILKRAQELARTAYPTDSLSATMLPDPFNYGSAMVDVVKITLKPITVKAAISRF